MSEPTRKPQRPAVAAARRVVIKIGTRVLAEPGGRLSLVRLFHVVEQVAKLRGRGADVLLVTSGAIGLGRDALGLERSPADLARRQACAAVGQSRLMGLYEMGFSRLGLLCAQVLLTRDDFADRIRYLNLRRALTDMLQLGVVPIINENDVVATDELEFVDGDRRRIIGDNDRLSALVASKLDADLLVLLTDVAGVFDKNPHDHADARPLIRIDDPAQMEIEVGGTGSDLGRGGMGSKIEAALIAARSGCHAVIASGLDLGALDRLLAGAEEGTWFPAGRSLSARRRWIAFATPTRGVLHLDAGATEAVVERNGSVLPAGVTHCDGDFRRGDVVELRGPDDRLIGRGVIQVDSEQARTWIEHGAQHEKRSHNRLVHRDELVVEPSVG
jgi:glutamate 5-kinase